MTEIKLCECGCGEPAPIATMTRVERGQRKGESQSWGSRLWAQTSDPKQQRRKVIPILRQGDVLLVPVDELPNDLKKVPKERGRIVLAHGEATGHAHVLEGDATFLAEDLQDLERRFLKVEEEAELVHDEHATITVPPGGYEVRRQREYEPEAPRYVAD